MVVWGDVTVPLLGHTIQPYSPLFTRSDPKLIDAMTDASKDTLAAAPARAITIEQAMADPDWIGPPVEDAWWRWDGRAVEYQLKREGTGIRDTWRQSIDGKGLAQRVNDANRGDLDASGAVFDREARRTAFARNGDIFVRELRSGALQQLTRTSEAESRPQWADDGGLVWRAGNDWYRWDGR